MIVESYVKDICKRIKGKRVLDIGCCATTEKNLLKRHNQYKKVAKEIIGVDINEHLLDLAKKAGAKNLYFCDITNSIDTSWIIEQFGKFDTIITTDVIEHIGNLTLFLDNIYNLLENNGKLYLTTPNMPSSRWLAMRYFNYLKINPDHVCWFDIVTLKVLLARSKLKVIEEMYHSPENKDAKMLGLQPKEWMARRLYVVVTKEEYNG